MAQKKKVSERGAYVRENEQERTEDRETHKKKERKKKETRIIEIGWLCMSPKDKILRQVRTKFGGGTRRINVVRNMNCKEILEKAKELFFPGGISTKGKLEHFEIELLDYKSHKTDLDLTVSEMYDLSALSTLRFYISTVYKQGIEISDDHDDHFIPATITSGQSTEAKQCEDVTSMPGAIPFSVNDEVLDFELSFPSTTLRRSARLMENSTVVTYLENFNEHAEPDLETHLEHSSESLQFSDAIILDTNLSIDNYNYDQTTAPFHTLILHRSHIFEDILKAFEQPFFDEGNIKVEMILPNGQSEMAADGGGVFRDCISEFWNTFYERCTIGTTMKIPCLRHDFGEVHWKAVAKIFIKGYRLHNYIPIKLSPAFLKTCFDKKLDEDELTQNFLLTLCESERDMLKQALEDFDSVEDNDLVDFFSTLDSKWLPNRDNLKQLVIDIAHREIIQKPAFIVKCFQQEIQGETIIAFNDVENLYSRIAPSVKNCLKKLIVVEPVSDKQKTIFGYLKKYMKEADERTRMAFFRFCTGSDLPINDINVQFIEVDGIRRMPIAHTCTCLLNLPDSYENFVNFRSEINSLFKSNVWVMDII